MAGYAMPSAVHLASNGVGSGLTRVSGQYGAPNLSVVGARENVPRVLRELRARARRRAGFEETVFDGSSDSSFNGAVI